METVLDQGALSTECGFFAFVALDCCGFGQYSVLMKEMTEEF